MIQASTLRFLKELAKNNNKPWFDAHKKEYEQARADFTHFIQMLIDKAAKKDASIKNILAKDCLFRINRDVRFAKDKSPYKKNFGASICIGGRKAINKAGYYFHLEPGGHSFFGGGLYGPDPETLRKLRQEIDYNFRAFNKIIAASTFQAVYGGLNHAAQYSLSRVPKGYEADNPAATYLKLKSFIGFATLPDAELGSPDLADKIASGFSALRPLIAFINGISED